MRWPAELPSELNYCKTSLDASHLIQTLISRSDEDLVYFFESAAFDEMWCAEYPEYMQGCFQWATTEFIRDRLSFSHAKRIVKTVLEHQRVLHHTIFYDTQFIVQGVTLEANSMMCGVASDYLRDLLRSEVKPLEPNIVVKIGLITTHLLKLILEYVHTGEIQKLPELERNERLELLRQASFWKMASLAKLVVKTLKLYIDNENLIQFLELAQQEGLTELKKWCFDYAENEHPGITLSMQQDDDFIVEISESRYRNVDFLKAISPLMTHLIAHKNITGEAEISEIIRMGKNLKVIDISYSSAISEAVLVALADSTSEELILSHCSWLKKTQLVMLQNCKQLRRLNISGNAHFDLLDLVEIAKFTQLYSLDMAECETCFDNILLAIAFGCKKLNRFTLTDNPEISDNGFVSFLNISKTIIHLDISSCNGITELGFIQGVSRRTELHSLVAQRSKGITETSLTQITRLCPELRLLDIRGCVLSNPSFVDQLRNNYPYLNIVF